MAAFKGAVSSAAPLLIQLTTGVATALVTEFTAEGENQLGAASRPTLSRPSTAGTGTGTPIPLDPGEPTSASSIVTNFSAYPTLPAPSSGAFNLPIRIRWVTPTSEAYVVYPGASALLYAVASGGHLWTGELLYIDR